MFATAIGNSHNLILFYTMSSEKPTDVQPQENLYANPNQRKSSCDCIKTAEGFLGFGRLTDEVTDAVPHGIPKQQADMGNTVPGDSTYGA